MLCLSFMQFIREKFLIDCTSVYLFVSLLLLCLLHVLSVCIKQMRLQKKKKSVFALFCGPETVTIHKMADENPRARRRASRGQSRWAVSGGKQIRQGGRQRGIRGPRVSPKHETGRSGKTRTARQNTPDNLATRQWKWGQCISLKVTEGEGEGGCGARQVRGSDGRKSGCVWNDRRVRIRQERG